MKPVCVLSVDGQYYFFFKDFANWTPQTKDYWLAFGKAAKSGRLGLFQKQEGNTV